MKYTLVSLTLVLLGILTAGCGGHDTLRLAENPAEVPQAGEPAKAEGGDSKMGGPAPTTPAGSGVGVPDSGGSEAVTGSGGKMGSGGSSAPSPKPDAGTTVPMGAGGSSGMVCGPVCTIFCEYGNVRDGNGCPTCKCNPVPVCKPMAGACVKCEYGYKKDAAGCATCECNPAPSCAPVLCKLFCANGFNKDATGCAVCECAPAACQDAECAALPPVAPCGPVQGIPQKTSVVCARGLEGKCAFQVSCFPSGCPAFNSQGFCARDDRCTWLEPGCKDPKTLTAGCYFKKDTNCKTDKDCGDGRKCTLQSINNCPPGAQCLTCSSPLTVCL